MTLALSAGGARAEDAATQAARAVQQGTALRRTGKLVLACLSFERAVALVPAWGMARLELAQCLRLAGDPDRAASAHLAAAQGDFQGKSVYWIEQARLAEDEGRPADALAAFARAQALFPAEIRASSGVALLGAEQGPGGLAKLRQFLAEQPGNLRAWTRVAEVAERQGLLDEAERALRRLLELSGDRSRAAAKLGRFGERVGRPGLAQEARRALARP